MKACPHCGAVGQMYRDEEDMACLQCGWREVSNSWAVPVGTSPSPTNRQGRPRLIGSAAVSAQERRRAYMREYMRRQRNTKSTA